jgi:hypothetical protein
MAAISQKSKERVGAGSVAERGMLFTLLLQSPYGIPKGDGTDNDGTGTHNDGTDSRNDGRGTDRDNILSSSAPSDPCDLIEKTELGFCLSSSVPRLLAGYEDGSVCCYDIRTFRY